MTDSQIIITLESEDTENLVGQGMTEKYNNALKK